MKLWGGRFDAPTDQEVEAFTSSLALDSRLALVDLRASRAHARSLERCGLLTAEEGATLATALESLEGEVARQVRVPHPGAEDVHSEIERWLREKAGPLAGKLHTGRSRNDQVATATRLYLREHIDGDVTALQTLQRWLLDTAALHTQTLLPGLTHTQHAQPVTLAHHLLAYFWMFQRDRERLLDCRKRVNTLPLGSGALAGTPYAIDRLKVAEELGFERVCENSLDAVSDRDFVVEYLAAGALVLTHLSRLSEEIILWNTPEFGFVSLSDAVTTGSSLMPQKKNPDVAELIRGRVGRLVGSLMGALTVLKALPLSYHRDLQEDKVHLFQGADTVRSCVQLALRTLQGVTFHRDRMRAVLEGDFSNATDLADLLVRRGLPFREAHEVVGRIVRYCLDQAITLEDLDETALEGFCPLFRGIKEVPSPESVVSARTSRGGTSPLAVKEQLRFAEEALAL